MKYKIAPSVFGADLGSLKEQLIELENNNVELLHVDVMDGHFVEKMAFGPDHVRMLKKLTKIPLDVHLMVQNPERILDSIIDAGADIITLHVESSDRLYSCLEKIKGAGLKGGLVLSPQTSEDRLTYLLDITDMVLVMTINPGQDNQKFKPEMLDKVKRVKRMIGSRDIDIEVDGGINNDNIRMCKEAGANVFVSGGYIFNGDIGKQVEVLRNEIGV